MGISEHTDRQTGVQRDWGAQEDGGKRSEHTDRGDLNAQTDGQCFATQQQGRNNAKEIRSRSNAAMK